MGGNSGSNGGGGREAQATNQYQQAARQREEKARQRELAAVKGGRSVVEKERQEFKEQGATNIKNMKFQTPATAILSKPLQAGSRYTRDYFKSEVLGKGAYKGTDVTSFEAMSRPAQESMYKGYITGRTSGKTDAYGREITSTGNGGGNQGNVVVQAPAAAATVAPTTAEVSQATAAQQEDITLRKKKILSKGRSPTIMTGVTGPTGSLTLGKPSLLGR